MKVIGHVLNGLLFIQNTPPFLIGSNSPVAFS